MKPKPHAHDEALAAALGFAVRKRLAGTAGDLTTDTLALLQCRHGGVGRDPWRAFASLHLGRATVADHFPAAGPAR